MVLYFCVPKFYLFTFQKEFGTTPEGKASWLIDDSKVNLNKDQIKILDN